MTALEASLSVAVTVTVPVAVVAVAAVSVLVTTPLVSGVMQESTDRRAE